MTFFQDFSHKKNIFVKYENRYFPFNTSGECNVVLEVAEIVDTRKKQSSMKI